MDAQAICAFVVRIWQNRFSHDEAQIKKVGANKEDPKTTWTSTSRMWFSHIYRNVPNSQTDRQRVNQFRLQSDRGAVWSVSTLFAILHLLVSLLHGSCPLSNIYIFIAIAFWDETGILVTVHFSMKNIYQSCDLGCDVGRSNVDISQ